MIPDLRIADITVRFPYDPESGRLGFQLFPTALEASLEPRRMTLGGLPHLPGTPGPHGAPAEKIDSLVQIKLLGDPYPGAFIQGHSMRNSPSVDRFRYVSHETVTEDRRTTRITRLRDVTGITLEHRTSWVAGESAIEVSTVCHNRSTQPITLEMLSSFSLGGITPFDPTDAPGHLRVHRFRSAWSAEGRLDTQSIEALHLERSWSGAGAFSERFGQVGTLPVRRWFPFAALEDTEARVLWGAQLAWAGSWQMEVYRQHDDVCLSGGLADREFGHWMKSLAPGESLATPPACISCVAGNLDDLCDRMTAVQQRTADTHPEVEHDLPIVFNEWCTTWGEPRHDKIVAIANRLKGSEVRYLVIDAGWYKEKDTDWSSGHGDWKPSEDLFPGGLDKTAAAIRESGLIPGLWFEMETLGSQSTAFHQMAAHTLQRDGQPITVRERRFLDLNDPKAFGYLVEKVIDRLERDGFGYLKIDYNETAGIGSDHPDSLGEGLRRQVLAGYRFLATLRERLPGLVIENCASGGHRLEPSMLGRTAMSSFSDAHEAVEIPIIAANLHRLMLPRQSQIWAVLHRSDSLRRLAYSLSATFLGRMCLSGGIAGLCEDQWELVRHAQRLYRLAVPIIKHGRSRRFGQIGESWRHPRGWQAVARAGSNRQQALLVIHTFAESPAEFEIPLPPAPGRWRINRSLTEPEALIDNQTLKLKSPGDFHGNVIMLEWKQ